MTGALRTNYDTVLYPGHALAQAHPDRLATIATLFGMTPANVRQCRVLELGCGDALNLVSIALGLPGSECVGLDLAAAGIETGRAMAKALRLNNINLLQRDLVEVGPELGKFDFIIAHGIYSWVPENVRDKLLAICKQNLAENGVAYVSYNTYPGGHLRDLARGMMRYHTDEFSDPKQKVDQAQTLIKFVIDASPEPDLYRMVLRKELERIAEFAVSSLYHDDLADWNFPVYFHEFAEHAARHEMQYLSETPFFEIQAGIYSPQVVDTLNRISDSRIAKEQYLDFLKCRRFRQTLLCHADRQLDYEPGPEKIQSFHVAAPLRPADANAGVESSGRSSFLGPHSSSVQSDSPLIKAAMLKLGEFWPESVYFPDLLDQARFSCGRANDSLDEDKSALGNTLLRAYAGGIIEFNLVPPGFACSPGQYPTASPLARLQIEVGSEVVNLRHFNIRVEDPLCRRLLKLLDGSRNRDALLDDLTALVESGDVVVETTDQSPIAGRETEIRRFLAGQLEQRLAELAARALLVA